MSSTENPPEVVAVNALQYRRILLRREARAKLKASGMSSRAPSRGEILSKEVIRDDQGRFLVEKRGRPSDHTEEDNKLRGKRQRGN
ncbi:hypothetical protein PROFUN_15412 [Planoprotostelium fungivorum]|uniref:Uncharacterized protein n=1 Tax=Planoprotostelium fungivorum TaxID=1890364 RepID=A0A2P6MW52_9EUKA|nr:hypothetical protein PROFUN_15412 [Planoprotostelium fungivorum]